MKPNVFWISLLLIGFFVNHLFAYSLGAFFFMPYEVAMYSCILLLFSMKSWNIKRSLLPLMIFVVALMFQALIGEFGGYVSFAQLIQKLLFFIGVLIVLVGFSGHYLGQQQVDRLVKILIGIFALEAIVVVLELVFGAPLLKFGIINIHGQSFRFFGFHNERLFLTELLLLGYIGVRYRFPRLDLPSFLFIVLATLINQSYTGILISLITYMILRKLRVVRIAAIGTLLSLLIVFVWQNKSLFLTEIGSVNAESKLEQYSENYDQSFRFIANEFLLEHFAESPTFLGYGMNSNAHFIARKLGTRKLVNSHSVLYLLHDGGIIGFLCFLVFYGYTTFRFIQYRRHIGYVEYDIALTLWVISTGRFLFYYHTYFHVYYLLAPVILELYISKKNEGIANQS